MLFVAMLCISISFVKKTYYKDSSDDFVKRNVEALSDGETEVGPLCMKWKKYECVTLGEKLEDHYPA